MTRAWPLSVRPREDRPWAFGWSGRVLHAGMWVAGPEVDCSCLTVSTESVFSRCDRYGARAQLLNLLWPLGQACSMRAQSCEVPAQWMCPALLIREGRPRAGVGDGEKPMG